MQCCLKDKSCKNENLIRQKIQVDNFPSTFPETDQVCKTPSYDNETDNNTKHIKKLNRQLTKILQLK